MAINHEAAGRNRQPVRVEPDESRHVRSLNKAQFESPQLKLDGTARITVCPNAFYISDDDRSVSEAKYRRRSDIHGFQHQAR